MLECCPNLRKKENRDTLWHLTKDQVESLMKREHRLQMYRTIGKVLKDSQENVSGLNRINIPAAPSIEPYQWVQTQRFGKVHGAV